MSDSPQLSITQRLPFTWERVCLAFWRRYPNPFAKHIVAEDIIDRRIVNGCLHTRRLLIKQRSPEALPYFMGLKSLATSTEYIVEDSVIDPAANSIVTNTRNVGILARLGVFTETALYTPCGNETRVLRNAWIRITVRVTDWVKRKANNYLLSNYAKRADDTNRGFLYVLTRMFPNVVEKARDNYKAGQVLARSARQSLRNRLQHAGSGASIGLLAKNCTTRCVCLVCSK